MMVEVFKYTERIVAMVRPRKLLFMAIGAFAKFSILICHDNVDFQTESPQGLK